MKQIIVMRKDLHMRKGKIAAQAGHACISVLLEIMKQRNLSIDTIYQDTKLSTWFNEGEAKICVYVESQEALLDIYNQAKAKNYIVSLIVDAGKTEFHNEEIDQITGGLPLY